jgi:hypothetical protein
MGFVAAAINRSSGCGSVKMMAGEYGHRLLLISAEFEDQKAYGIFPGSLDGQSSRMA